MDKEEVRVIASEEVRRQFELRDWNAMMLKFFTSDSNRREVERIAAEQGKSAAKIFVKSTGFKESVREDVKNEFNRQVLASPAFTLAVAEKVKEIESKGGAVVTRATCQIETYSKRACDALVDGKYTPLFEALERRAEQRAVAASLEKVAELTCDARQAVAQLQATSYQEQKARMDLEGELQKIGSLQEELHKAKRKLEDVQTRQYAGWGVLALGIIGGLWYRTKSSL